MQLGKRFQRTVSMAHIGTAASCNPNTEKAAAAMSTTEAEQQPISQWEILKHAEEMMMLMMAGAPRAETSTVTAPSSSETTRTSASTGQASQGAAMLQHSHSSEIRPAGFIPRVNFLDNCFFCKRRLKHERDIFIYRGDAAFCTEECRQRQIVKDE